MILKVPRSSTGSDPGGGPAGLAGRGGHGDVAAEADDIVEGHRQLNRPQAHRYPQLGPDPQIAMPERQPR